MPQITLYIPKAIDESWRAATPAERTELANKLRSVLRSRLAANAARIAADEQDGASPRTSEKGDA